MQMMAESGGDEEGGYLDVTKRIEERARERKREITSEREREAKGKNSRGS